MAEKKALAEENQALEQEKCKLMQQLASLQAQLDDQGSAPDRKSVRSSKFGSGAMAADARASTPREGWVAMPAAADAASAGAGRHVAAAASPEPQAGSPGVKLRAHAHSTGNASLRSPARVTSASIISMSDQLQAALQLLQSSLSRAADKLNLRGGTDAATQELSSVCQLLRRQLVKTVGPRAVEMEAVMRNVLDWAQDAQVCAMALRACM